MEHFVTTRVTLQRVIVQGLNDFSNGFRGSDNLFTLNFTCTIKKIPVQNVVHYFKSFLVFD